ncbi:MAG: hypothetical protein RLN70_09290, partial [Rhodospirillaceae bacterium]
MALAACGPLPQPFRGSPSVSSSNPFLDVPTAVGVAVLPVNGIPDAAQQDIGEAVAEQLRSMEVPAEAVSYNAGLGFSLEGVAEAVDQLPSGVSATIAWTLRSRDGKHIGTYRQQLNVSETWWREGGAQREADGRDVASAVLDMIGSDPIPTARQAPTKTQATTVFPSVSVKPVEGAPGDGRNSLRLAILQSLAMNGVPRDDVNPHVVLVCDVSITPYDQRLQVVEILWRAILPDGSELGTVKLDNTIPVGALNQAWGATAFAIADAAAPDLLQLLAT